MARTRGKSVTLIMAEAAPMMFPAGTVRTHRPSQSNPYGIPWTNVSRWEPWFSQFGTEWGVDPRLLAAMAVVESDGNQYRHHRKTGTRDEVLIGGDHFDANPSVGIMQIKPAFHQATLPEASVYTPDGNIRLGARLMRDFTNQTGSWQNAIRLKYHPGTSPADTTPDEYVEAIESLLNELAAATPCLPDPPPPFDGEKKVIGDVTLFPDRRTVTVTTDGLNCRKYANTDACFTREPFRAGERVNVLYWLRVAGSPGENRWWVGEDGSRFWVGGTAEKPTADTEGTLFDDMVAAGMRITQGPGGTHSHRICDCYDFGIRVGTPIRALARGKVVMSEATNDVYRPNKVMVRTEELGDHIYAHLSRRDVNVGDFVEAGALLGLSGDEQGPHLHLGLWHGVSALGLNLTQILEREGFDLDVFPGFSGISMIPEAAGLEAPPLLAAPLIIDKWLPTPKWNRNRYDPDSGVQSQPRFIVIHIQEGSSTNSWNYHAYHVQASATVFANRDGSIWRCVPEEHGPWTNGDTCRSTAAGQRVLNLGGDPNNWCLTIETEGFPGPNSFGWAAGPTEPQFRSVLWQVQTWMERYNIPAENVLRHADFNNCTHAQYAQFVNPQCSPEFGRWCGRSHCPGDPYYQRLIDALREGVIEEAAAPPPPAFTGADVVINGHVFHAVPSGEQEVRSAKDQLECYKWATTSSPLVHAPLALGEAFTAHYWVEGQNINGELRWWVTDEGARIWCGGTDRTPEDII